MALNLIGKIFDFVSKTNKRMNNENNSNTEEIKNSEIENKELHKENIEEKDNTTENKNKIEEELAAQKDKYVRLYADFENFRKRTQKDIWEMRQMAAKDVLKSILVIADDFERALKAAENTTDETLKNGTQLIYNKLKNILEQNGVKPIESIGKDFNIEFHEAITEIQMGEENEGKIVDEVERGYMIHDNVLRYAKVIVGKKNEA